MDIRNPGPKLGDDTNTELFLNILIFISFVTMSCKGYCVSILRRNDDFGWTNNATVLFETQVYLTNFCLFFCLLHLPHV